MLLLLMLGCLGSCKNNRDQQLIGRIAMRAQMLGASSLPLALQDIPCRRLGTHFGLSLSLCLIRHSRYLQDTRSSTRTTEALLYTPCQTQKVPCSRIVPRNPALRILPSAPYLKLEPCTAVPSVAPACFLPSFSPQSVHSTLHQERHLTGEAVLRDADSSAI